jgi:hypothetical protein
MNLGPICCLSEFVLPVLFSQCLLACSFIKAAAAEVVIAAAPAAWVCCQFHMDFELLQRIHNMDMLIDDWRTQVAEEAQAAKAAKQTAAQYEGADKSAAAATSFRGSMHSLPGQPKALLAMVSRNSVSCLFEAA